MLVPGATGSAGTTAVPIARLFGGEQVVAVGRDADALTGLLALGATETVVLDGRPDLAHGLGEGGNDVDVDHLWGEPTTDALSAMITRRSGYGQQLTWLQIGSVTGATAPIPSAALRAAGCRSWADTTTKRIVLTPQA